MSRVLSAAEAEPLWQRIVQAWDVRPGFWYPLGDTTRMDVLALEAGPFHAGGGVAILRGCLAQHGVTRCWEFREFTHEPTLELELDEFDAAYTGSERYWTADPPDWLVYASHEESMTLGGQWLIDAFKRAWPSWRLGLWKCGDSTFVHRSV